MPTERLFGEGISPFPNDPGVTPRVLPEIEKRRSNITSITNTDVIPPYIAPFKSQSLVNLAEQSPEQLNDLSIQEVDLAPKGRPTLRVSKAYGRARNMVVLIRGGDIVAQLEFEKAILKIFEDNGYVIERNGDFNSLNQNEIGINARPKEFSGYRNTEDARNRLIVSETGAIMPHSYATPLEIMSTDKPVVAKRSVDQQGIGKYLLESEEQKARFLTWALLGANTLSSIAENPHPEEVMHSLVEKVKRRDFSDPRFARDQGLFPGYTIEDYIQTPSEYNSSYRVVADTNGRIHYGLLLHSSSKKGEELVKPNDMDVDPLEEVRNLGSYVKLLLNHPDSPLFIPPASVVSNYARGGKEIILNGQKVEDPVERQVALEHGIDPDNPQIPDSLRELSAKIGKACRADYPYVGIDFLQSASDPLTYYFLEANISPGIDPEDIGLDPQKYSKADSALELMKRVVSSS